MNYFLSAAIITLIVPVWGLFIHMLNRLLYSILKRLTGTRFALIVVNYLTFPGVIHHELSHALFATVTGAQITEFRPFWPDKNTGSLGNVGFIARGSLLFRSIQLAFTASAPVITGTISSILLAGIIKAGTLPLYTLILLIYLMFSILIHASMSTADVRIMFKGIWVLFLAMCVICCYYDVDLLVYFNNI